MANEKRLIDANATADAIAEVMDKYDGYDSCQNKVIQGLMKAQDVVADAPTVDAVEVVRCKDCRRCFKHTTKRNKQIMWLCMRNEMEVCVRPDDFCSYGERRTDNG